MNIIEFNATDNHNFTISLVTCREQFDFFGEVQARYSVAMSNATVPQSKLVIYQMVGLAQYQMLSAFAAFMRCHFSEAWASARVAIDAAIIGEHLNRIPDDQVRYLKSERDIQYLIQTYKKRIKQGNGLPHEHIQTLIERYDFCSSHASHADINVFIHRLRVHTDDSDQRLMSISPYQIPDNPNETKILMFDLVETFALVLDMFSPFFMEVRSDLPQEWSASIRQLISVIDSRRNALKQST